jgi:hypothetical protein
VAELAELSHGRSLIISQIEAGGADRTIPSQNEDERGRTGPIEAGRIPGRRRQAGVVGRSTWRAAAI